MSSDCSKQQLYVKLLETEKKLDQLLKNESIKPIQVELLHQYNDIKDATQVVIGHLANIEGTSVSEIHKRMNLFDWNKTKINNGTFYLKTNTTLYNLNSSNIFFVSMN